MRVDIQVFQMAPEAWSEDRTALCGSGNRSLLLQRQIALAQNSLAMDRRLVVNLGNCT